MTESPAVAVALAHITAWTHHDWARTEALLARGVRLRASTTWPEPRDVELIGVAAYMAPKIRAAQLVEPASLKILAAVGDERSALVTIQFAIALGPDRGLVTMVRSCLYLIDQNHLIAEERDVYCVLADASS